MPGVLVHIIAACIISILAVLYYHDHRISKRAKLLPLMVFLIFWFSVFPDVFLALYYVFGVSDFFTMVQPHMIVHLLFFGVSVVAVVLLKFVVDVPKEPLFVMVFVSMVVHVVMDFFIPELGILI